MCFVSSRYSHHWLMYCAYDAWWINQPSVDTGICWNAGRGGRSGLSGALYLCGRQWKLMNMYSTFLTLQVDRLKCVFCTDPQRSSWDWVPATHNGNLQINALFTDSLPFPVSLLLLPFSIFCVCVCVPSHFSCVQLFVSRWTVAHQAPQSMGFSRQEYWSGLPFPPPGDLPDSGIEPVSPASPTLQVDSLLLSHNYV